MRILFSALVLRQNFSFKTSLHTRTKPCEKDVCEIWIPYILHPYFQVQLPLGKLLGRGHLVPEMKNKNLSE